MLGFSNNSIRVRWIPELKEFADERERRRMWRSALAHSGYWTGVYCLWAWLVVAPLISKSCERAIAPHLPTGLPPEVITAPANLGVFVIGFAYLLKRKRRSIERYLRQQLRAQGKPICIDCGYDLRGQTGAHCPECGAQFNPTDVSLRGDVRGIANE